jgi:hypothetical protein
VIGFTNNAKLWRDRAAGVRAEARYFEDPEVKTALEWIAQTYERLAESTEARLKKEEKQSKGGD